MSMFTMAAALSAFLFGSEPEEIGVNGDKSNGCGTIPSDTFAEGSVGNEEKRDEEKRDLDAINQYYALSKKRRCSLEELLPLSALQEGQKGKIVFAVGGYKLIRRLCDLGLVPGTEFKVLKKGLMEGPIILEVRSFELAIGRGIASKVLVKPI